MENTLNTLNRLISGAFNDISRVEQKAIKDSGLTDVSVNEAHTVDAIGLYVPKTMSAVAEKLEITMGTLTVAINHLVRKGYVNKIRDEKDRRVYLLSLTEKGKQLFKVHQRFHLELVKSLIVDLSDYEADMFIEALGCVNAWAFDLSAACSGFVYALSVADKFVKSGQYKKVLVFGAETLSKIVDWTDRATCVLFGDGAGGALVEPSEDSGIIDEDMHSKGEDGIKLTGGERKVRNMVCNPEEENKNYLEMDGRAIFNFATKTVPKSVSILLERNNLTVDDIKYIVPHQANSRIIEVVAKKLKTTMDKFFIDVDEFGNTSAASIPIALGHMDSKGLLKKGDYIIITGFGGGLTWGSTLIKW